MGVHKSLWYGDERGFLEEVKAELGSGQERTDQAERASGQRGEQALLVPVPTAFFPQEPAPLPLTFLSFP